MEEPVEAESDLFVVVETVGAFQSRRYGVQWLVYDTLKEEVAYPLMTGVVTRLWVSDAGGIYFTNPETGKKVRLLR